MEDYRSRTSGLTTTYVDLNDLEAVAAAIKPETQLIWIESPTNPLLHLVDIKAVCDLAKAQGHPDLHRQHLLLAVEPAPITLGVDLVMHSASKYIGGHSDLTGGVVVAANDALLARLRRISMAIGAVQGPFDCYLALRGLKTLDVRMERQSANACRWRASSKATRRSSRCITQGWKATRSMRCASVRCAVAGRWWR
jgi:cystathionine gamma-lyase